MGITFLYPDLPSTVFSQLHSDSRYKNVHISTTDGTVVLAHSAVLAAVTGKFQALFSGSSYGAYKLSTPGITAKQWDILLELIHTGRVGPLPEGFNVKRLREVCESLDMVTLVQFLQEQEQHHGRKEQDQEQGPDFGMVILDNEIQGGSLNVGCRLPGVQTIEVDSMRDKRKEDEENTSWISDNSARVTSSQSFVGRNPISDDEDNDTAFEEEDQIVEREEVIIVDDDEDEVQEVDIKQEVEEAIMEGVDMSEMPQDEEEDEEVDDDVGVFDQGTLTSIKVEPGLNQRYSVTRKLIKKSKQLKEKPVMNLTCKECNHTSGSVFEAARHLQAQHGVAKCFRCRVCNKGFNTQSSLCVHVKWQCSTTTKRGQSRVAKMMRLNCDICGYVGGNVSQAAKHLKEVHGETKCFICKVCDASFKWEAQLYIHAQSDCAEEGSSSSQVPATAGMLHVEKTENCKSGTSKKCSTCGHWSDTIKAAGRHLKVAHGVEKCYSCKKCSSEFEEYSAYIFHFRENCNKRPRGPGRHVVKNHFMEMRCSFCNKDFPSLRRTASHYRSVHSLSKPFICAFCGKGHRLYTHLSYHFKNRCPGTGSKKRTHVAPIGSSKCVQNAPKFVQKEKHKQMHYASRRKSRLGMMDLKCSFCSHNSNFFRQAAEHLKDVHGIDKCYTCKACGKNFSSYNNLYNHFKTMCPIATSKASSTITSHQPKVSGSVSHLKKGQSALKRKGAFIPRYVETCCPKCGHDSGYGERAARHLKEVHKVDKCYICKRCKKGFYNYQRMLYHYKQLCGKTKYKVLKEESKVKDRSHKDIKLARRLPVQVPSSMKVEVNMGHPIKSDFLQLKCQICGLENASKDEAVLHMKNMHGEELCCTCKYCGKRFKDETSLIYHGLIKCKNSKHPSSLGDKSIQSISLQPSSSSETSIQPSSSSEVPVRRVGRPLKYNFTQLKCHICGLESVSIKMAVQHLKDVHGNTKGHVCIFCGDGFSYYTSLQKHALYHCPEAPKQAKEMKKGSQPVKKHSQLPQTKPSQGAREGLKSKRGRPALHHCMQMKCQFCGKESSKIKEAVGHLRKVHEQIRCFTCRYCQQTFLNSTGLAVHAKEFCEARSGAADMQLGVLKGAIGLERSASYSEASTFSENVESEGMAELSTRSIDEVWEDDDDEEDDHQFQPQIAQLQGNFQSHDGSTSLKKKGPGRPTMYGFMQLTCQVCGQEHSSVTKAAKHMKLSHNELDCFTCKHCSKKFMTLNSLTMHGKKYHGMKSKNEKNTFAGKEVKQPEKGVFEPSSTISKPPDELVKIEIDLAAEGDVEMPQIDGGAFACEVVSDANVPAPIEVAPTYLSSNLEGMGIELDQLEESNTEICDVEIIGMPVERPMDLHPGQDQSKNVHSQQSADNMHENIQQEIEEPVQSTSSDVYFDSSNMSGFDVEQRAGAIGGRQVIETVQLEIDGEKMIIDTNMEESEDEDNFVYFGE